MRQVSLFCALLVFNEVWALPQGTSYWAAKGTCNSACRGEGHRPETAQIILFVRGARLCGEIHQDYGAAYANKSPSGKLAGSIIHGAAVVGFVDTFTDPKYPGAASLQLVQHRLRWTTVMPTLVLRPDRMLFGRISRAPLGMEMAEIERSCSEFFENPGDRAVREYLERQ